MPSDTDARIPAQLDVVAWPDSVIDVLGFTVAGRRRCPLTPAS
jgi:hypothetical protein